jgi:hypothetical protein
MEGQQPLLAPYGFSKGDRKLIFRADSLETGHDLMMLSLDASRKVEPLLQTPFNELNAEISLDGRWLALRRKTRLSAAHPRDCSRITTTWAARRVSDARMMWRQMANGFS